MILLISLGASGLIGASGASGLFGALGASGESSLIRASGVSGLIGASGASGLFGALGASGASSLIRESGLFGASDVLNKPLNKPDARKRQKIDKNIHRTRQFFKEVGWQTDGDWLEEVYDKLELCPGRIIDLYYGESDGTWRAMIVSVPAASKSTY